MKRDNSLTATNRRKPKKQKKVSKSAAADDIAKRYLELLSLRAQIFEAEGRRNSQ
jgi:hypothetical protein